MIDHNLLVKRISVLNLAF